MRISLNLTGIQLAVAGFAFLLALIPATAFAQGTSIADQIKAACTANPASCRSFDPEVNPILKLQNYTVNRPNNDFDAGGKVIPKNGPDGSCVLYNVPGIGGSSFGGSTASGCLKDGQFTVEGIVMSGAGPTGEAITGTASTDQTGQTTYTPNTGGLPNPTAGTDCDALNIGTWPGCLLKGAASAILLFTNTLLGIAGTLFNWAVVKTVLQFPQFIGNSPGLLIAWGIMRDIGNIIVLFGFILIGIGTILNTDKLPNKNILPKLVIFAVLLNFSLFIVEAVIDVSNAFSTVMYTQANTTPCVGLGQDECAVNYGLAGHIMQSTGLSPFALDSTAGVETTAILGLILFSLIGAVVLFAGALMLIIRGVILSFLMILSPIGFASMVIPSMKKLRDSYWNTLIKESFFAPVFLLLLLVSLKITDGFSGTGENASLAAALTQRNADVMGVFVVFFAVCGFMIASLIFAKKFGAIGADGAIKFASGATFGTAGFIGRRTLGAGSVAVARKIRTSSIGQTETGRLLAGVADKAGKANYDLRMNKTVQGLAKSQKLDLGKLQGPAAKGIEEIKKVEAKKRTDYAATLKLSAKEEARVKEIDTLLPAEATKIKGVQESIDKEKQQTTKVWETRKTEIETKIKELEAKPKVNPEEEKARLAREIAVERAKGETATDISAKLQSSANLAKLEQQLRGVDEAAKKDVEELGNLRTALTTEGDAYKKKVQELEEQKRKEEEASKKRIAELEAEKKTLNPQERYAQHLEEGYQKRITPFTLAKVKQEAADTIRKNMKQTKEDKAIAKLKDALAKGDSKEVGEKLDEVLESVKEDAKKEGGAG